MSCREERRERGSEEVGLVLELQGEEAQHHINDEITPDVTKQAVIRMMGRGEAAGKERGEEGIMSANLCIRLSPRKRLLNEHKSQQGKRWCRC